MPRGAGGTNGGIFSFFLGIAMLIGGGYLFLDSIRIAHNFGWGRGLYHVGGVNVTSGMLLIPFIFGMVITFYNAKNPLGWFLWAGSIIALCFGVLRSVQFTLRGMSAFDLLVILVLIAGGLGTVLASLRDMKRPKGNLDNWP